MKKKIKELLLNEQEINIILGKSLLTSIGYKVELTKDEHSLLRDSLDYLMLIDYNIYQHEFHYGSTVLENDASYYNSPTDWKICVTTDTCCDDVQDGEWLGCEGTKETIEVFGFKTDEDVVRKVTIEEYHDQAGGMLSNNYKSNTTKHLVFTDEEYSNLFIK